MVNNAEQIVLESLAEITGLESEELTEIRMSNLFENGILDSLSLVNLLTRIEKKSKAHIDIRLLKPENILTIDALIAMTAAL